MCTIGTLKMSELYRLLALYRERLRMLDRRDPRLALVALGEEGEYARYRAHFTRKIWQLEAELEREDGKITRLQRGSPRPVSKP